MPPIELGPIASPATRIAAAAPIASGAKTPLAAPAAAEPIVRAAALGAGTAPIDTERVALIRKAVEAGTYPVVPARIADAMIAAKFLLGATT